MIARGWGGEGRRRLLGRGRPVGGGGGGGGGAGADQVLHLLEELRVLPQVRLGLLAALAQPLLFEGEEGALLPDGAGVDRQVEDVSLTAYAHAGAVEDDVELRATEGGGQLVLDDLGPGAAGGDEAAR